MYTHNGGASRLDCMRRQLASLDTTTKECLMVSGRTKCQCFTMSMSVCQSCVHLQCMFSLMMTIFSGPARFTITSVTVGAGRNLINVTFVQVSHVTCDDDWLLSTTTMKSPHMH